MHEAITQMLARYECRRVEDAVRALREILQEVALLGLWRSKFFEKAAFYGGTALRIFHGLDRFSEDLDFSLLKPMPDFNLGAYEEALRAEVRSFGFDIEVVQKEKTSATAIQSAFLKADTLKHLLVITPKVGGIEMIPRGQQVKVKLEVDTNPPPGFATEAKFALHPIPFSVKTYALPDLFAGKMHAILCRKWKSRVKGRDWYDLVWFAANHPKLHLAHLEQRMRQSGHYKESEALTADAFRALLAKTIEVLPVDQARREVEPFVQDPQALDVWSGAFFKDIAQRIEVV
ncbi:MAG: nucleotidyl transferase AbiEii/AbiGii toxin family protein [bacterium]